VSSDSWFVIRREATRNPVRNGASRRQSLIVRCRKVKVKFSPLQALEALRVVRG
jgi:hypothetical protein